MKSIDTKHTHKSMSRAITVATKVSYLRANRHDISMTGNWAPSSGGTSVGNLCNFRHDFTSNKTTTMMINGVE
jgi:hypothetical protein